MLSVIGDVCVCVCLEFAILFNEKLNCISLLCMFYFYFSNISILDCINDFWILKKKIDAVSMYDGKFILPLLNRKGPVTLSKDNSSPTL
jgi:hypothetical protein